MISIRATSDLEECHRLWKNHWPRECLFDLWQLRTAFLAPFGRQPFFLVAEGGGKPLGLLALSWIAEKGYYGHFPGELWNGKTWLEQNKIIAASPTVSSALVDAVPGPVHVRYLQPGYCNLPDQPVQHDETGYLFSPADFNFSFATYLAHFPGKTRRKIERETRAINSQGVVISHNQLADVEKLFTLNLEAYKEWSYFADERFARAFENLVAWLWDQGLLRLTSVRIGGKLAAVDLGAVWQGTYTLLAGGTNGAFPGVAKVINLHHLEWSCAQRIKLVDFLCGDFNWKERFRLTARPLYAFSNMQAIDEPLDGREEEIAHAC
ncbi:MAG: GNAT family N-acetyltransferase [Deltaproteobacteria bacterium]|nr:GNAT family N-acetyltransferase [Candidatus Anaeroferrophillus wilburensis]MBN2887744.1 GNAT family N-acetyltransferase [Deltaproteobacteria bacterium]